jgi:hypothetical protein
MLPRRKLFCGIRDSPCTNKINNFQFHRCVFLIRKSLRATTFSHTKNICTVRLNRPMKTSDFRPLMPSREWDTSLPFWGLYVCIHEIWIADEQLQKREKWRNAREEKLCLRLFYPLYFGPFIDAVPSVRVRRNVLLRRKLYFSTLCCLPPQSEITTKKLCKLQWELLKAYRWCNYDWFLLFNWI